MESSNALDPWLGALATSLLPSVTSGLSKSHLVNLTKTPLPLSSPRKSLGFSGALRQHGAERKRVFLVRTVDDEGAAGGPCRLKRPRVTTRGDLNTKIPN